MGSGKRVGVVTQMCYTLLSFIRTFHSHSLRVGLSSEKVFNAQDTWLHDGRWMS